jgi:hypothetical protein
VEVTLGGKTVQEVYHRIGYLQGLIHGISMYAVNHNGQQVVGVMRRPLHEVVGKYETELSELLNAVGEADAVLR